MPISNLAFVVLLAPLAMLAVAVLAGPLHASARSVGRALSWANRLGIAVAAAAAGILTLSGDGATPLLGAGGLGLSVRIDALSVVILAMVSLLALVIGRFSRTYLDGDPRHGIFLGRLAATTAAVEVLVVANNLALLWVAWVATSLCLHQLLVFYPDRPRAITGARKKFVAARAGDLTLGIALALLGLAFGTADLATILDGAAAHGSDAAMQSATLLLALTALLKSAQFPTYGWLVEVMETPTPVSALLHAGILNAGPFLILRFAPVMELGTLSAVLLVAGGGITALVASVVLRTQPSVKVALGYSSAAHMGFMLLVCGLGVYAAAALHLVAHSFYKAHAFLSAGSVVDQARAKRARIAPSAGSPLRAAAGFGLACLIYLTVALTLGFEPWHEPALLLVGAILILGVGQLVGAGLHGRLGIGSMLRVAGSAALVSLAFFGLEEGARLLLLNSLPAITAPEPAALAAATLVLSAFAGAVWIQVTRFGEKSDLAHRLHVHVRNAFYVNTLFDRVVAAHRR